jgi:hypothetical protein
MINNLNQLTDVMCLLVRLVRSSVLFLIFIIVLEHYYGDFIVLLYLVLYYNLIVVSYLVLYYLLYET